MYWGIEHEGRNLRVGNLRDVLDLDVLALDRGRRCLFDDRQHDFVELGGTNAALAVEINLLGSFEDLEDALFGDSRSEDDGEIDEWCHALTDGSLEGGDSSLRLIFDEVPFVDNDDERLVVLLDELEDVHVLRLDATCGVNHEDADVGILNGTDRTHDAVELEVFRHLVLTTDAGSIDEIEVEAELVVLGINRIARGTGNLSDDITVLTDEGVDDAGLAGIGTTYNGKARGVVVDVGNIDRRKFRQDVRKGITVSAIT